MSQLSLNRILVDQEIQIRHGTNEDTVRHYMEILDKLPPITVFDTVQGWLLADGFHRVEAAKRLGWKSIKAGLRKGARNDALEFAAKANANNPLPLTKGEREDAVRRLLRLHPDLPYARIAEQLSVSESFVSSVVAIDTMRSRLGSTAGELNGHQLNKLSRLPAADQRPVAEAAVRRQWDSMMVDLAVNNLKDPRVPEDFKEKLREGIVEPVFVGKDGSFAMPIQAIVRETQRLADNDPLLALEQALAALARLRTFGWREIIQSADRTRRERIRSELPGYIGFLEEGLRPSLQVLDA